MLKMLPNSVCMSKAFYECNNAIHFYIKPIKDFPPLYGIYANIEDPYLTPQNVASDQGSQCLLMGGLSKFYLNEIYRPVVLNWK